MAANKMIVSGEQLEIPISLIAQYLYCKRRAALMALYSEWNDNEHTIAGTIEHERVHETGIFTNNACKTYHGLRVKSEHMGIAGVCDRVDYEFDTGQYIPIEFKHGKRRNEIAYEAQLCAQTLCLEEMLGCAITTGYVYYVTEKRRKEIKFTEKLRADTHAAIRELRTMLSDAKLPAAAVSPKCCGCSLHDICVPHSPNSIYAQTYVNKILAFAQGGDEA